MTDANITANIVEENITVSYVEENITANIIYDEITVHVDSWSSSTNTVSYDDITESLYSFAFGDATPANLLNINANKLIFNVEIVILTAFDGVGATLSIGDADNPNRLMSTSLNNPNVSGTYTATPDYKYDTNTQLKLYINAGSGASVGNGLIIIKSQV